MSTIHEKFPNNCVGCNRILKNMHRIPEQIINCVDYLTVENNEYFYIRQCKNCGHEHKIITKPVN